jgi:hypothetical protein
VRVFEREMRSPDPVHAFYFLVPVTDCWQRAATRCEINEILLLLRLERNACHHAPSRLPDVV